MDIIYKKELLEFYINELFIDDNVQVYRKIFNGIIQDELDIAEHLKACISNFSFYSITGEFAYFDDICCFYDNNRKELQDLFIEKMDSMYGSPIIPYVEDNIKQADIELNIDEAAKAIYGTEPIEDGKAYVASVIIWGMISDLDNILSEPENVSSIINKYEQKVLLKNKDKFQSNRLKL